MTLTFALRYWVAIQMEKATNFRNISSLRRRRRLRVVAKRVVLATALCVQAEDLAGTEGKDIGFSLTG
jgi:hypothetical protein